MLSRDRKGAGSAEPSLAVAAQMKNIKAGRFDSLEKTRICSHAGGILIG
jgi:hypothetical protein